MRRLTAAEIEAARRTPGRAVLLFITDRCPVGCGHCSVDSRPDSPRITDFDLFERLVDGLCAGGWDIVGVSGGEPFVERRALTLVSERVTAAGKDLVVYTSGYWARSPHTPDWIRRVVARCSTVYLSTDAFHYAAFADDRFARAARVIADEAPWIVVQVVDADGMVARTEALLAQALGPGWRGHAEIRPTQLLPYGRAAGMPTRKRTTLGADYGPCDKPAAPTVRYDGRVSACCNEAVVMGHGPGVLRRQATSAAELAGAFDSLRREPVIAAINQVGPGAMARHPRFRDLADRPFTSICQVCWAMGERAPGLGDDRLLAAMALLGANTSVTGGTPA